MISSKIDKLNAAWKSQKEKVCYFNQQKCVLTLNTKNNMKKIISSYLQNPILIRWKIQDNIKIKMG